MPGGFRPISMEASASRHLEVEAEGSVEERLERGELENETADSEVQVVPAQPRPNRPEVDERQASTDSIDLEHTRTAMAMFAQRPIWARSTWRYPTVTGEVPRYMQRAFRLKTFGLITLQLLLILLLAVPLRMSGFAEHIPEPEGMENFFHQGIVYMFGVVNLVALLLLNCYKDRYPANYALWAFSVLTSGVFWAVAYTKNFMTMVQFEILGILLITMVMAMVISRVLSNMERKFSGSQVLALSFLPGWFLACLALALQAFVRSEQAPLEMISAICVSAVLLGILFLDAGKLMVRCDPDDFMRVVISMNATIMVVVSIPFFFLAFCMLRLDQQQDELPAAPTTLADPPELTNRVGAAELRVAGY